MKKKQYKYTLIENVLLVFGIMMLIITVTAPIIINNNYNNAYNTFCEEKDMNLTEKRVNLDKTVFHIKCDETVYFNVSCYKKCLEYDEFLQCNNRKLICE